MGMQEYESENPFPVGLLPQPWSPGGPLGLLATATVAWNPFGTVCHNLAMGWPRGT